MTWRNSAKSLHCLPDACMTVNTRCHNIFDKESIETLLSLSEGIEKRFNFFKYSNP